MVKFVTRNLLYRPGVTPQPVPPTPGEGRQLRYLMNGDGTSSTKVRNWSIDTGITWRDVFNRAGVLGISKPGLETEIRYAYSTIPPEGGVFAGCNPRYNQAGGGGSRDMGGFWRIFGHSGAHFCFDCPSEDDRNQISGQMEANRIYTETCKYGYLDGITLRSYLKVTYLSQNPYGEVTVGSNWLLNPRYSWTNAALPHNLYLWSDNSQSSGDTAPREGVKIYRFTVWYLDGETRHTKVYEGVPWMDANNVPCIKDLVSGQLQYNCASNPSPFLYAELS